MRERQTPMAQVRGRPDPTKRAAADRLRAQIGEALERAKEASARTGGGAATTAGGSEPAAQPTDDDGDALTDRVGLDPETGKALHTQLMPLADECIELARERDATLSGMLAMEFGVAGDPDLGAVVDTVDFPEDRNELRDEELLTCMRETALSMTLPAPQNGGRLDLLITLPVEAPR